MICKSHLFLAHLRYSIPNPFLKHTSHVINYLSLDNSPANLDDSFEQIALSHLIQQTTQKYDLRNFPDLVDGN